MLRVCLIGAGRIGRIHAANLWAHREAALHSVVDLDLSAAEALAAQHDAAALQDANDAITDPAIDAVIIASASHTHGDLTSRCVAANKAVFCEKPLDLSLQRAEACADAVRDAKTPVFVGFNRRFDPSHRAAKQAIDTGEVGTVELIVITSRDPRPPTRQYLQQAPQALYRETMIHDFDMARWLLGEEPRELFVMGASLVSDELRQMGQTDTAVATLRTASGQLCQINNSWRASYGYDQRLEVLGSKGMVRSDNWRKTTVERFSADATFREPYLDFFIERYRQSYQHELDHFIQVAQGRSSPAVTVDDGVQALRLAEAAVESAASARLVQVAA